MVGLERNGNGSVTVSRNTTFVSLGLAMFLIGGSVGVTAWAFGIKQEMTGQLTSIDKQVAGLRQALDYSVDRTARAMTIVDRQDDEIQRLKRELAVVQTRLGNLERRPGT